ncbi:hypothetical protein RHSP_33602 [Rhizobium freirei PRF 81]|uniref:Uncharacterized protein n=1 Tax=Rhizobium freirei PRF 81 TaxID=363754 RepID=N6U7D6_9HYPH|nr:hypothetical protein RHSP_33602 [Rhizobium freirei PRF 81]
MAGIHVGLQQDRRVARRLVAQLGDPLGWFPIGDARVGEATKRKDRRIGLLADIVVGAVRGDLLVFLPAVDRIAPFGPFRRRQRQGVVEHGIEHVDEGDCGDDAGEFLRCHVGDSTHQHAACRTALGDDLRVRGELLLIQIVGGRDEVLERIGFLGHLAVFVPGKTLVLAAADMGYGVDEAAVRKRQAVGVEAGRNGDAVGAVAIEQAGSRAVERRVLAVKQRYRHLFAVPCGREDAPGDVVRGIVAGGHFLSLQKGAFARHHIVVEELARRRHRRVGEADDVGIVFRSPLQAERIGLLFEGDGMFFARTAIADDDARQAVLAFQPDEMAGIGHVVEDQRAWLVGHHLAPVFLARLVGWRHHDLEILGVAVVGQDVEDVAAFGNLILDPRLASGHDLGFGGQVGCRDDAVFAGLVVVDVDEDVVVEQRAADTHEEAGIFLFIDEPVLRLRRAKDVVEDFRRAMILVLQRVEEALAVGRPDAAAAGVLKDIGKIFAGFEVTDLQREIFRALVVIAPDAEAVIGGVVEAGKAEIGLSLIFLVAVEQQLAIAAVAGFAKIMRLLAAGDEKRAVGIGPVLDRDRAVILLDTALHLAEESLLQILRVGHRSVHIGVFSFQMGADFRGQDRRILEHRLPVVCTQPCIVIAAADAMMRIRNWMFRGGRRGGEVLEYGHESAFSGSESRMRREQRDRGRLHEVQ